MTVRVVWTKTALRGVWRAYDYLVDVNPEAARSMVQALLDAGDSLVSHSHRGRMVVGTTMRELVSVSPYIIRYRVDGDQIVVLRIRHSARRPTNP